MHPRTTVPGPSSRAGSAETLGLVVVDKEAGWTSHDAVARCRRIFSQRRVGHAGTLDPDATGVLLVGLGRFTRMLRFLTGLPKSYEGEVVLGRTTNTLDASGSVTGTWDMSGVTLSDVRRAARSLTGVVDQVPPMVSARKVGGRRLHELARAGIEVEREARPVTVTRFDVDASPDADADVFRIAVDCSTGTYVRVLAADLGQALGGGAHLRALRRTRVGSFGVDEAHLLGVLGDEHVLTPAQALRDLPQIELDAEMERSVSHGLALDRVSVGAGGDGPWALLDRHGDLLAVYEATGTDRMVAVCVLAGRG
jgi:tRNA pseudouridine55 synthase